MKRIMSAVLAAIVLAMAISGCSDNTEVSTPSTGNSTTVNDSTNNESTTESNESTGDESTTESTPDENSDPDGDNEVNPAVANAALEYPDNRAGRIVRTMLSSDEWGFMMLMNEETTPALIPDLSLDDCEEYCLAYCPNGTQLMYALAVKPKAGSEEKVENALATFYGNVKNNPDLAFYPMQQAAAEGAVMDTTDDGYICVIVHENGQTIGDAIENVQ
ncbi:MAG: hypothetical protein HDT42_08715 [Ruminococcaceae bacterium]|nr:hypothetical protein [Oscillospiraceae bacterium]